MLAQIDGQRAHAFDNPAAGVPAMHGVGGSVREIRVSASGVTSRIVREWPDVAGERIMPIALSCQR